MAFWVDRLLREPANQIAQNKYKFISVGTEMAANEKHERGRRTWKIGL